MNKLYALASSRNLYVALLGSVSCRVEKACIGIQGNITKVTVNRSIIVPKNTK